MQHTACRVLLTGNRETNLGFELAQALLAQAIQVLLVQGLHGVHLAVQLVLHLAKTKTGLPGL